MDLKTQKNTGKRKVRCKYRVKNFIIAIDYASMYHGFQSVFSTRDSIIIENKICESIHALERYVKNLDPKSQIHIAGKVAYVLPNEVYGSPEKTLPKKAGVVIKRVNEPLEKKTLKMKQMNLSRRDDEVLTNEVISVMKNNNIQGVILISNDNDFYELAMKVRKSAKDFWLASIDFKRDGVNLMPGQLVKNFSDKNIPLLEVLNGADLELTRSEDELEDIESLNMSSIDIYKGKRLIISYPMDRSEITIGRKSVSKKHLPNIDLSQFDEKKNISRMHGTIQVSKTQVVFNIDKDASAPTWDGMRLKRSGEKFNLIPNRPVILGKNKEFMLVYRYKR